MEQYFQEAMVENNMIREDESSLNKWRSSSDAVAHCDDRFSGGFDCNICLDTVQDPVVTLCGHLFCWPCIYTWLHFQSMSAEDQDKEQQRCPVCKAEVSPSTLVPLYGRGQTSKPSNVKSPHLGLPIPKRPIGPTCGVDSPRSSTSPRLTPALNHRNHPHHYYSQPDNYPASPTLGSGSITTNLFEPVIGMFGEMVYARMFGNSITNIYTYPNSYHLAGNTSPRIRRHLMQANKSLDRICFFLFCCLVLCLLLF